MIARYAGKCYLCLAPITVGKDEYDYEQKRSFHRLCVEQDEAQGPTPEQVALAERLGYIHWRQEMGVDGFLRAVSQSSPGIAAWGLESSSHRGQKYALRPKAESDTIDCIRPPGGHA